MSADPLASIADYETFVYGLPEAFASIQMSTLVVVHTGPLTAVVRGEIHFGQGLALRVLEVVNARQRQIERYGYELWRADRELWWYDRVLDCIGLSPAAPCGFILAHGTPRAENRGPSGGSPGRS